MIDPVIKKTIKSLEKRKIRGMIAENASRAREIICDIVPEKAFVGIGDSSSVRQVGAVDALKKRGNVVMNGFDPLKKITDIQTHFDNGFWPMLEASVCDVFLRWGLILKT